jgi:hypothetical protein
LGGRDRDLPGEIELRLSATLRRDLERRLPVLFRSARRQAARRLEQHGEDEAARRLPEICPYSLDDVLGDIEPWDD